MFSNYQEWRAAITDICGQALTPAYCRERLAALGDASDSSTQAFSDLYGAEYLQQVTGWFQRAESEAMP